MLSLDFALCGTVGVLMANASLNGRPGDGLISERIVDRHQTDVFPGPGSQSGVGNIVQSLFLSTALPTASGIIWGLVRCSSCLLPVIHCWVLNKDIGATFVQPFVTCITPTRTTFSLNTESTYDWKAKQ